jgi:16S rRNA processing protein RimM
MALRYIGTIISSHKTKGAMFVGDAERHIRNLQNSGIIHIGFSEKFTRPFTLTSFRKAPRGFYITVKEVTSPEQVTELKEHGVFADEEMLRSSNSSLVFDDEIIGCKVFEESTNTMIGIVSDVLDMPAHDVWVIQKSQEDNKEEASELEEILIPAVEEFIVQCSVRQRKVVLRTIPGLIDSDTENVTEDDVKEKT